VAARSGPRGGAARDAAVVAAATADLEARIVSVGVWLALSADLFFFAAWWFSFFYLRALNLNGSWTPNHIGPPSRAFGIAVLVLVILMALSYWFISRVAAGTLLFYLLGPISLILGVVAVVLQAWRMWHLGFGMTDGGYASVFAGLTGAWLIHLLAAVLWLGTNIAQSGPTGDVILRRREASTFSWILVWLAAVGVINFIILYLVH
jgi:heme/copper-type cytochrome/quinol oxidase subunit 3